MRNFIIQLESAGMLVCLLLTLPFLFSSQTAESHVKEIKPKRLVEVKEELLELIEVDITPQKVFKNSKTRKYPIPVGASDIDCLALNLYFEARNEKPDTAIAAVGYVTLERVSKSIWPNDICKVVWEQRRDRRTKKWVGIFSWTLDGKTDIPKNKKSYEKMKLIAQQVLDGSIENTVDTATHYHHKTINPYWAPKMKKVASIGTHIFYR